MTLTHLLIGLIALAAVFTAGIGFQLWRGRRHVPGEQGHLRALEVFRERASQVIAPQSSAFDRRPPGPKRGDAVMSRNPSSAPARQGSPGGGQWPARPGPRVVQTVDLPATVALDDDWPPELSVTARTAGPAGAAQQDVYYVQRNLVALARGLTNTEGRRAAALTLSAIMTSSLGQAADVEQAFLEGARAANRMVRSISRRDPRHSDMVTTLDVVYMTVERRKLQVNYAHVGSSTIWLQQVGSPAVAPLTKPHVGADGPVTRAVGLARDIAPDTGRASVEIGDRIFLTTASPSFTFTEALMNGAAGYRADRPLRDAIAALAETVYRAGVAEEVMIVGAEVSQLGGFAAR